MEHKVERYAQQFQKLLILFKWYISPHFFSAHRFSCFDAGSNKSYFCLSLIL